MTDSTFITVFILAGLFWACLLALGLLVYTGIRRLRTPKLPVEPCTRILEKADAVHVCGQTGTCNGYPRTAAVNLEHWTRDWDSIERDGGGA